MITLSLPPVVWGLSSGQMHSFVLLGSLAVVVFLLEDKPWHAGAVAGLLTIKPQVALAFLVFFVARRNVRACIAAVLAFGGVNALLVSTVGTETALSLYATYIDTTHALVMLPYTEGFPRDLDGGARLLLGRTLLLPSLVTPYLMVYDAAPLMASCLLIVPATMPRVALALSGIVYFGLLVYPVVSGAIGIPLGALLPIGIWVVSTLTNAPTRFTEVPHRGDAEPLAR